MNTPANMSVAAHIRAEHEPGGYGFVCGMASGENPPSTPRVSSPCLQDCHFAYIASQLHRRPPEKRPGYIPAASVGEESVDRRGSVSAASPVVGRYQPLQPIDSMILRVAAAAAAAAVALLWSC